MIATCPEPELLRRYANGLVSEAQADELTSHLRDCPSCQNWLADAQDLDDTLVGQLRHSTVDESFTLEQQCQSAMAVALGALAAAGQGGSDPELELPSSIGDYEIVRSIGRGGMGNVYLAQHMKLDRTVAVKVLASHRLSDPRMHDRFQQEMRAIGSLSHPNIVTAYDARDVDGVALLVTEWIDGLDLKEIVSRTGPLSVANVCEIGANIAGALTYVAEQSLVHRDLKPSNVMVSRDGEVKLLDLGLARLRTADAEQEASAATATGQAMGTADYVAPEQINDAREVDIQADIYSLGCTMYKLLCGRAPFEHDRYPTAFTKLTAHVAEKPLPLRDVAPDVPPAVANLVDQMLLKSPGDRPTSPDAIAATLRKHSSGADLQTLVRTALVTEPTPSPQPLGAASATTRTQPFWRRRVPISVAIAAGILGLLVGWFTGVTITITHPDGSKTEVGAPKSSRVVVHENGNVDIALRGAPEDTQAAAPSDEMVDVADLAGPDDLPKFEGVWRAEVTMNRGRDAPIVAVEGLAMVFHRGELVMMQRSRPMMAGQVELDSDQHRLTLTVPGHGNQPPETYKAIYRFRGDDKLQLCIPKAGTADFPVSIEPIRMSDVSTVTFSRIDFDSDPTAIPMLMQDPASKDLLHSIALYQRLKSNKHDTASMTEAIRRAEAASFEVQSVNNLKQLAIAFHNYHDAHQVFPTSQGAPGKRKLKEGEHPCSWRVAILPFIDQAKLYEQYNFQQPWDSPDNLKVLEKMPATYRKPGAPADSTTTGYVGFAGENTMLGKDEPKRIRDATDGTSNTVMLVEAETDIPWTKPEDYSLDQIAETGLLDLESLLVALADGSVRTLEPVTAEVIKEVATINDGRFFRELTAPAATRR